MSNTTELLDLVNDLLGGGSPKVLKAEHQPLLNALVNSLLNKETDAFLLGLLKHDPSKPYVIGAGTLKDGQLWQAKQAIPIEPFDPSKWEQITGTVALSDYEIAEWENDFPSGSSGGYPLDAKAIRDDRLWNSDSASNTDDPLTSGWTEISANDGKFGNNWVVGLYKQNQVVTNPSTKKLYYLATATPTPQGFSSVDIDAEIIAGDFVLFHDVAGVGNNLSDTLSVGNETTGNNIIISPGDRIQLATDVYLYNNGSFTILEQNGQTMIFDGITQHDAGITVRNAPLSLVSQDLLFNKLFSGIGTLTASLITTARNWQLPDISGIIALISDIVYGSEQDYIEDEGEDTTTSLVYQPKIDHTTPVLSVGDYMIEWQCEVSQNDTTNAYVDVFVQIGVITIANPVMEVKDSGNWEALSGFKKLTLGVAGTLELSMDWRALVNGTAGIRRARMSVTKIAN